MFSDDFKPASVDPNKPATLDVSTNNQVTVNVPHLNGSGVPQTVFKGNQRNYTKECVLIIDKVTGEITLVKLHHNIQVKKTRSESTSKPSAIMPPQKINENLTQRTQSKTKVSTGVRKNPIINNTSQRHSPLPGSPSNRQNKSPLQQNAPLWHANNVQSTLPSIPLIGLDDDPLPSSSSSAMTGNNNIPIEMNILQPLSLSQQTNSMGSIPTENDEPMSFNNDIGVLSSSDSSSDSESSESGSDSDSSANNTPAKRK